MTSPGGTTHRGARRADGRAGPRRADEPGGRRGDRVARANWQADGARTQTRSVAAGRTAQAAASDADRIIDAAMALIASRRVAERVAGGGRRRNGADGPPRLPGLSVPRRDPVRLLPADRRGGAGERRSRRETGERPRDRVFDLLMRRFDALQPYRAPLTALRRDLADRSAERACARARRCCARCGSISKPPAFRPMGIGGVVAVKLVAAAYLFASQTWARDESPDLAPTMAALDRRLRGIERFLVPRRRGGGRSEAAA